MEKETVSFLKSALKTEPIPEWWFDEDFIEINNTYTSFLNGQNCLSCYFYKPPGYCTANSKEFPCLTPNGVIVYVRN